MLVAALMAASVAGVEATITASAVGAASVPGPPRGVSADPGDGAATVSWKAPLSDGGSAITMYVVTPYLANVAQPKHTFSAAQTKRVIAGLTNGKAYSFKVAARNASGSGPAAGTSVPTTVGAPGRPGGGRAAYLYNNPSGDLGMVNVFAASPNDNGSPITRFTARCSSSNGGVGGKGIREKPAVQIVIVSGLTSGKTYRCYVTATNARGTGPRSRISNALVVQ
jgi:hypothetical protein